MGLERYPHLSLAAELGDSRVGLVDTDWSRDRILTVNLSLTLINQVLPVAVIGVCGHIKVVGGSQRNRIAQIANLKLKRGAAWVRCICEWIVRYQIDTPSVI